MYGRKQDKFYTRNYAKAFNTIQDLNKYFKAQNMDVRYTILKKMNFLYLFEITDKLEDYVKSIGIQFVKGKGKRKTEIQLLYERIAECVVKMVKYETHYDHFKGRNSFSKTQMRMIWEVSRQR